MVVLSLNVENAEMMLQDKPDFFVEILATQDWFVFIFLCLLGLVGLYLKILSNHSTALVC